MSENSSEAVPDREAGEASSYMDVGGGFYVRFERTPGGSRVLHVLDGGTYLGSVVIDVGGCRFQGGIRVDYTDQDQRRAVSPPTNSPYSRPIPNFGPPIRW